MFSKKKKEEEVQEQVQEQSQDQPKDQTAMEPVQSQDDQLSEYTDEERAEILGTTGLEDLPQERRRIPLVQWNLDMRDEHGNSVRPDMFYNVQTCVQKEFINCALLFVKETYLRFTRDQTTQKKFIHCRSFDCVHGNPTPTEQNPNPGAINCENCEYRRKTKAGEAKKCSIVNRVVCFDLDEKDYFLLNILKSSYVPFNNYLQKNFFGKIKIGNKRSDMPLYMAHTIMKLKEETGNGKRYYVLDPQYGNLLPKNIVMDLLPSVQASVKKMNRKDIEVDGPDTTNISVDSATAESSGVASSVDDDDVPF